MILTCFTSSLPHLSLPHPPAASPWGSIIIMLPTAEGISYLVIVALVAYSLYTKV